MTLGLRGEPMTEKGEHASGAASSGPSGSSNEGDDTEADGTGGDRFEDGIDDAELTELLTGVNVRVTGRGVHVIETTAVAGARVTVTPGGGWRTQRAPRLRIRGRDRTSLVDLAERRADLVRRILGEDLAATVPVVPVLCFTESTTLGGTTMRVGRTLVLGPERLATVLGRGGPLTPTVQAEVRVRLHRRLRTLPRLRS